MVTCFTISENFINRMVIETLFLSYEYGGIEIHSDKSLFNIQRADNVMLSNEETKKLKVLRSSWPQCKHFWG